MSRNGGSRSGSRLEPRFATEKTRHDMDTFQSGDRVQLRSGGAPMTVSSRALGERERYACQWFVEGRMLFEVFEVGEIGPAPITSSSGDRW
jgi:uncharacterized protein YodC (DUF2158 family)